MRSLAVLITLIVLTPPLGLIVILAGVCGVRDRPGGVYDRLPRLWARAVCAAAGARMHVSGEENQPRPGGTGVVYCSNHVSWFDVLGLAAVVPRNTFVAKQELSRIPIFGRAARASGMVFIDRRNRKAAFSSYERAAEVVRGGKSIIVCPEGTRGYDYRLRPFKKGPFVLAISAGVPVVPTVVYGAREVQSKGRARIRGGDVYIHFLQPVPTAGLTYEQREELMFTVWRKMADFLREKYGVESSGGPLANDPETEAIPTSFF
jgi:1-acyl-sn-glycerol-3-phosphate acyltransferase